jgi:hypothetical protein
LKWNLPKEVRVPWDLTDFDASLRRLIRIDHIYQDFIRSATLNAKILIKELFDDRKQKIRCVWEFTIAVLL